MTLGPCVLRLTGFAEHRAARELKTAAIDSDVAGSAEAALEHAAALDAERPAAGALTLRWRGMRQGPAQLRLPPARDRTFAAVSARRSNSAAACAAG